MRFCDAPPDECGDRISTAPSSYAPRDIFELLKKAERPVSKDVG
jgi:hypothetical protein